MTALSLHLSLRHLPHDLLCALRLRIDRGTWVLDDQVLACGYPRREAALSALASQRIEVIVNLHPRALPLTARSHHAFTEVHLPLRDFRAPSVDLLRCGVAAIEDALAVGRRVAVHCGGGRGRTGTLLACLLVARGVAPDAAIEHVRRRRPGAVETRRQAEAVRAFARAIVGP